jgi:hypothetical protein
MLIAYLNFGRLFEHMYWIASMMDLINPAPMTVEAYSIQFDAHVTHGQRASHKIVQEFLWGIVACSLERVR